MILSKQIGWIALTATAAAATGMMTVAAWAGPMGWPGAIAGLAVAAAACATLMLRRIGWLTRRLDQVDCERRELEARLRDADVERRHAGAVLRSISDAVLVTDAFNVLALSNEAAARALRFDLAEALHQPIDRVIDDRVLVGLIEDARVNGAPRSCRSIEHRVGRNGQSLVYNVTLSRLADARQEVGGVVTILRDISRKKELAEMKSEFVAGVSHELRTPLSSIKAYIEMLADGEAADEQTRAEFYNIIQSETNRLSRLIDNILTISRIESGLAPVRREAVSPWAIVHEAVEAMRPQAHARRVEVREHGSGDGRRILADREMVAQALLNLIDNAILYTPPGGLVTVETAPAESGEVVVISVSDTGTGVHPESLPHLFNKFYRAPDHKQSTKGAGLGLNLVRHVVETMHHGSVRVESQPGEGSVFRLHLPLVGWAGDAGSGEIHTTSTEEVLHDDE